MDVALVLAIALHTVGFVIAWGYYGVLGRIVLPALRRTGDPAQAATILAAVERRAVPLVLISMVMFVVTGTYLLAVDAHYAGLGNVFASTWTTLMLVKHVVVVGLVGCAVGIDILVRRAERAATPQLRESTLGRVGLAAEAATALGAVIVLLTSAAQVAG
jgi:uncharacterized membrane protein